jgi:hypothetical protein
LIFPALPTLPILSPGIPIGSRISVGRNFLDVFEIMSTLGKKEFDVLFKPSNEFFTDTSIAIGNHFTKLNSPHSRSVSYIIRQRHDF